MSNPLYRQCERLTVDGQAPCLNEGLYFCRLCCKRFCEDDLCEHLAAQYDDGELKRKPTIVERASVDATLFGMEDDETEQGFRAYSEQQLRELPEMRLVMRKARLFAELKRIQTELERRMVYSTELMGIRRRSPIMASGRYSVPAATGAVKSAQQSARKDAADTKRQSKIQEALNILAEQLASGKVSKAQLQNQIRKAK